MRQQQEENPTSLALAIVLAIGMVVFGQSWKVPLFEYAGWGLGGLASALLVKFGTRRALFNRRLRRALGGPGAFGCGRLANEKDLKAANMIGRKAGEGLFVGALGKHLLFWQPESHGMTVAAAGLGKTSSICSPNLAQMAALAPSYGAVVTDKDGELAAMWWPFVSKRLPASVCLNPFGQHGLPNHHFNPLQDVIDLAQSGSRDVVMTARGKAAIIVAEPEQSGDNKFFRDVARDIATWVLVHLATDRPEQCCLPGLFDAVNGGDKALLHLWLDMQSSAAAEGQVARAGARFQSLMDNADRTFQGVISELQQALSLWDGYSTLGQSTARSDFHPNILKDGPAMVLLVVPEDRVQVIAKHVALVVDSLASAVMRHKNKHPRVVFLLDEFQRLPVMPSIPAVLYRGRGSGLTLWIVVQDRRSLRAYGKDESAFNTQCEMIQFIGVRDPADADYLVARIGQTTLRTQSISVPQDTSATPSYSVNYGEQAAPVLRKDEILQAPEGTQFIVYRNRPVIWANIVPWWLVHPWRKWPADNPKEGGRPRVRPRFFMSYRRFW